MILCSRDYAAESDYDFKWNEFEEMSLEAAQGDEDWQSEFEEATVVADNYDDFLRRIMSGEIVL